MVRIQKKYKNGHFIHIIRHLSITALCLWDAEHMTLRHVEWVTRTALYDKDTDTKLTKSTYQGKKNKMFLNNVNW